MPKLSKRDHKSATLLLFGAIGIVLVWRGVWAIADITPVLREPWVSFAAGLIILVITHQFYRML